MEARIDFSVTRQPDGTTCGPACLHAVYRHFGDELPLEQVVAEVPSLGGGGTLGVLLGCHALRRGYPARLFTYNLQIFDPTWAELGPGELSDRLTAQAAAKPSPRLRWATDAYLEFLALGGELSFEDLSGRLLRRFLDRGRPILTGLSATYLYQESREIGTGKEDDLGGEPVGHFVVLCGYDRPSRRVLVADPLPQPSRPEPLYPVSIDRLICAVLLGILTFDANLLILEPRG